MATTDIAWEIQKGIYGVLSSDSTLLSIANGVFDKLMPNEEFPYVVIGEMTERVNDAFANTGSEFTITLHIWSQAAGFNQALAIKFRIYQLLHRKHTSIIMNGYTCTGCRHDISMTMRDPDGLTRHVITRYRVWAE